MAAIQHHHGSTEHHGILSASPGRPVLRVLEGGRSSARLRAVYRRRRIVAGLLLVSALAVLSLVMVPAGRAAARGYGLGATPPVHVDIAPGHEVLIVQPGDTLWSIARSLQPTGDIIPLVDRLAELHGPAALQAGERLDLSPLAG